MDVEGKPLRPRKEEVAYLIKRVEQQITRSALNAYKKIAETAR